MHEAVLLVQEIHLVELAHPVELIPPVMALIEVVFIFSGTVVLLPEVQLGWKPVRMGWRMWTGSKEV